MARWDDDDVFEEEDTSPATTTTGFVSLERNHWVKDSWDDDDDDGKHAKTTASTKAPETKGKNQANAKAKPAAAEAATPSEISTSDAVAEKNQKQSDDEPIEKFIPKSEKEFAEYAERIAKDLLRPYEKSYHYIGLMKAMNKLAVASLTSSNVKEIVSSMTTVANEKLKAENAGKKKQGHKKNRLHVNKAEGQSSRNVEDDRDDDSLTS
ncbi:hypothetical protein E2562_006281 [Oryza meyeriana var. granulata]|uniref:Uncharacterized protein n=1 Tax=Oryza meyeriana var. granulata TaxID=110450 RepID=A0A6G1EG29_9ORYZ|nr:hypothetical protein E2562_006281 [Oryza meyeriana var. granulata]